MTNDWLERSLEASTYLGLQVVKEVLDSDFVEETKVAMVRVKERLEGEVGRDGLERAGE